jgi:hypothetical protein
MHVPFGIEHAFEGRFPQQADKSVDIVESLGLGGEFAGQLLGLELESCVHASISVRKVG